MARDTAWDKERGLRIRGKRAFFSAARFPDSGKQGVLLYVKSLDFRNALDDGSLRKRLVIQYWKPPPPPPPGSGKNHALKNGANSTLFKAVTQLSSHFVRKYNHHLGVHANSQTVLILSDEACYDRGTVAHFLLKKI